MVFIERATMTKSATVNISPRSVIRVAWHSAINQIVAACADGVMRVLYDPVKSTKGALLCVAKQAKRRDPLNTIEYQYALLLGPGSTSPHVSK